MCARLLVCCVTYADDFSLLGKGKGKAAKSKAASKSKGKGRGRGKKALLEEGEAEEEALLEPPAAPDSKTEGLPNKPAAPANSHTEGLPEVAPADSNTEGLPEVAPADSNTEGLPEDPLAAAAGPPTKKPKRSYTTA